MSYEPDEILAEFGYTLKRNLINLPKTSMALEQLSELKSSIQRRLPFVSLTSEAARREILIAPIVLTLIDYTQAQLRIEYILNVSEQLKGSLDYYLHTKETLIVIEAKNADLAKGFTQLAVELIALVNGSTRIPRSSTEPFPLGMFGNSASSTARKNKFTKTSTCTESLLTSKNSFKSSLRS